MTAADARTPRIKGLFETHLNVASLERSMQFYEEVLGLQRGTVDADRRLAIYWIGGWGRAFLGLWEKPPALIVRQHFAFEVELRHLDEATRALAQHGIEVRDFFGVRTAVPTVFGWIPAASVYFSDPDGHELEFLARLPGPPRPDAGIVSLNAWQQMSDRS